MKFSVHTTSICTRLPHHLDVFAFQASPCVGKVTLPGFFGPSDVRELLGKELVMPKKRFSAEQIVTLLRQIEVSIAQGKLAPITCRDAGISLQNYAMSC
jgi:hypothetical protein